LHLQQNTALARAQGFNKPHFEAFFDTLSGIFDQEKVTANRIFNMDENKLSTVQEGQKQIVAQRGKRQVGTVSSGERGESATCVVCVSAVRT